MGEEASEGAAELTRLLDERLILNEALARKKEMGGGQQEGGARQAAGGALVSRAGATGIRVVVSDGIDALGQGGAAAAARGQLQLFLGHAQGWWLSLLGLLDWCGRCKVLVRDGCWMRHAQASTTDSRQPTVRWVRALLWRTSASSRSRLTKTRW